MKTIQKGFLSILIFLGFNSLSYSQCGTETVSIVGGGYCNNQNAEIQILDNSTTSSYKWFNTLGNFTSNFTYTKDYTSLTSIATTSGAQLFQYQKQYTSIGGPSPTLITSPTSGTPISYNSNVTATPHLG
jgi:hypothetical protein